jgi:CRP-like cAMP-binding protein
MPSDSKSPRPPRRDEGADALSALRDRLRDRPALDLETRLRLADLLLAAGREPEALRAFLALADELCDSGLATRALAVLRRVEALQPGCDDVEARLVRLAQEHAREAHAPVAEATSSVAAAPDTGSAPTLIDAARSEAPPAAAASVIESLVEESPRAARGRRASIARDEALSRELLDLVESTLARPAAEPPSSAEGRTAHLLRSPIFADLTVPELMAVMRRLRLCDYEPGDILMTEGEEGQSLYVLSRGRVKIFVRSPTGRDVQVSELGGNDFFGEVSAISGRSRSATITAAVSSEVLELRKEELDAIASAHPRVRDALDAAFVARASNAAANVVRAIDLTAQGRVHEQADIALEAHFGRSRWDPRTRLRLAQALIRAGHGDEALPIVAELALRLVRSGRPAQAEALLKRIEKHVDRDVAEIHLAPLRRQRPIAARGREQGERAGSTEAVFQRWLIQTARERLGDRGREATRGPAVDETLVVENYGPGLRANPLFESLSEESLAALVRGLRLFTAEAGDVILTEGEQGESLFVLVHGSVKVWVRDPSGRNVRVCCLDEGSFFGEVATISGRPRCASVTAADRCVLLEINRDDLAAIRKSHPHIGEVIEAQFVTRAAPKPPAHQA